MQPFTFLAGTEVLGSLHPEWGLDQAPEGGSERAFRARVPFSRPFQSPPLVQLGITGFDIGHQDAARLVVAAEQVTAEGFDLVLSTWLSTRLWRVNVSWLAIGA